MDKLGRLEHVDLRSVWANEAGDFTPWLAQDENLALLGETIGIALELEAQEKEVGPFRADILCRDTATDDWVLVENQLEHTDHVHLGQLMTYAAGLKAVTIVWVARAFTEEHRAALDWLNEITDERFNFFGLEVEVWRIGGSLSAPKFNIVSKPNEWTRRMKRITGDGELSELRLSQLEIWTDFKEYMNSESRLRCGKAPPRAALRFSFDISGVGLEAVAATSDTEKADVKGMYRVDLILENVDMRERWFSWLHDRKDEIEKELGEPLEWRDPAGEKKGRIVSRREMDIFDKSLREEAFAWMKDRLEAFHDVFLRHLREMRTESE